ncbi:MAG: hypothetical protein KatS3mg068_1910 [Candidatus Sericytochromatia bacterium]|nr:MAG: hypothetical protein KatS3mg068_1910 [Candidatus Sericytochromatia bacterium]
MAYKLFLSILFILLIEFKLCASPTLLGDDGFINTPSAKVLKDRKANIGIAYLPGKSSLIYTGTDNLVYSLFFGFLPRTEVGLVYNQIFTGKRDRDNPYLSTSFFDRSVHVKFQFLEESNFIPALSIGGRDIFSNSVLNPRDNIVITSHQQAFYIVIGKEIFNTKLNLGYSYAPDLPIGVTSNKAYSYVNRSFRMNGIFFAIQSPKIFNTSFILEYDSKNINYGIDLEAIQNFNIKLSMVNLVNFNIRINWNPNL